MQKNQVVALARMHASALNAAAEYLNTSAETLQTAFLAVATTALVSALGLLPDADAAFGVVLAAIAAIPCKSASMKTVAAIERLTDPILRDVAYRTYRLHQTPEEIAKREGVKPIVVQQQIKRIQRLLGTEELSPLVNGHEDPPLVASDLQKVVTEKSCDKAPGRVAVANAAAASEQAQDTVVTVGRRSVRGLRGRPWIEPSEPRKPITRMVAERRAEYAPARSFDLKRPDQDWVARLNIYEDGASVSLLDGDELAALNSHGELIGQCTKDAPTLTLPGIVLPTELHLRRLGTAT